MRERSMMNPVISRRIPNAFARSGIFPAVATPSLLAIGGALVAMIADGTLFVHVLYTLYRIVVGLALAAIVGVPLGMLMGRFGIIGISSFQSIRQSQRFGA